MNGKSAGTYPHHFDVVYAHHAWRAYELPSQQCHNLTSRIKTFIKQKESID